MISPSWGSRYIQNKRIKGKRTKKKGEIKVKKKQQKTTKEKTFYSYSSLGERVGCMIIPSWGEGGQNGYGIPTGEAGL